MKVITETQETIMSTVLASQTMTLDARDPVLWQALSATIYTKARWILEYAQNAHDVDPNWKLVLPSLLSPYCEFIDNGPSMSEDFMLSRGEHENSGFCTAFASTKRDSNATMGGFGIGRLSGPQGTVIECRNPDAIRTYVLVKDENKIPMLNLQAVTPRPADVPVGTTVRVPVSPRDFGKVEEEARRQLLFFNPEPIPGIRPDFYLRGEHWGIVKRAPSAESGCTIIVGGYPYKVDPESFPGYTGYHANNPFLSALCCNRLMLWMPIGSVDISLNRESLRYEDRTATAVKAFIEQAILEMRQELIDKVQAQPTLWDARLLWVNVTKGTEFLAAAAKPTTISYQGQPLVTDPYFGSLRRIDLPRTIGECDRAQLVKRRARSRRPVLTDALSFSQTKGVAVSNDALFVIADGHSAQQRLVKHTEPTNVIYLIPQDHADDILARLGNPPVKRLSEYPDIPRTKVKLPTRPHSFFVYEVGRAEYGSNYVVHTRRADPTLPTHGVWVKSKNSEPELSELFKIMLLRCGIDMVYGVPASNRDLVPANWTYVTDALRAALPAPETVMRAHYAKTALAAAGQARGHAVHDFVLELAGPLGIPEFIRYADDTAWLNTLTMPHTQAYREAYAWLGDTLAPWTPAHDPQLVAQLEWIVTRYPLVTFVANHVRSTQLNSDDYQRLYAALIGGIAA